MVKNTILSTTLKSTTGKLTTADQVFDESQNKSQQQINADLKAGISSAYKFRGTAVDLEAIKNSAPLKIGDVFNLTSGFSLYGKAYPSGTNVAIIKEATSSAQIGINYEDYIDALGGTIDGLVTRTELDGKNYQSASQVESAITAKGYQTAGQVTTAINNTTSGKLLSDIDKQKINLVSDASVTSGLAVDILSYNAGSYTGTQYDALKSLWDYLYGVYSASLSSGAKISYIIAGNTATQVWVFDVTQSAGVLKFAFMYQGKYYQCTLDENTDSQPTMVVTWDANGIDFLQISSISEKVNTVEGANSIVRLSTSEKLLTKGQDDAINVILGHRSSSVDYLDVDILSLDNGVFTNSPTLHDLWAEIQSDTKTRIKLVRAGNSVVVASLLEKIYETYFVRICFIQNGNYYECSLQSTGYNEVTFNWIHKGISILDLASHITALESKSTWYTLT